MIDPTIDWREVLHRIRDGVQIDFGGDEIIAPVCSVCEGTGYIRYNVRPDDPRFGKMYPCPDPNCPSATAHRRQQSETVMHHSTWEVDYGDLTFESFWNLVDSMNAWDSKRGAYAAAMTYATNGGQPFTLNEAAKKVLSLRWPGADERSSHSVVLTGDVGLGKTGLAVAAVNELRALNKPVVFIRTLELIRRIQETYKQDYQGESTETRLRFYSTVPYLILDEFGIKAYTDNRLEILETIIRDRDRARLPILMTTNLTLEQVYDLWQPQIADIVAKAHWVQVGGAKLRQTVRKVETW